MTEYLLVIYIGGVMLGMVAAGFLSKHNEVMQNIEYLLLAIVLWPLLAAILLLVLPFIVLYKLGELLASAEKRK